MEYDNQRSQPRLCRWRRISTKVSFYTLAMLNIEPPEPKNSGSHAEDPISLAYLLGLLHIVEIRPVVQQLAGSFLTGATVYSAMSSQELILTIFASWENGITRVRQCY
jgi:hypothetical protein